MGPPSRLSQLTTLNALGEVLNREADFELALPEALQRLVSLLGLSTGWAFLSNVRHGDRHQGTFFLAAATGLPPALAVNSRQPLCEGSCECQGLLRRGRLERGVNMVTCSRLASAEGDRGGLELHASVPLLGHAGPVGILNLAAPGDTRFDEETLAFLAAVGKQLGTAFERSRLQAERLQAASYAAVLEERQRLAQEMHDSLAQLLFAADLSLQASLAEAGEAPPATLRRAADALQAALADLQSLVEVMRPADPEGGLGPALERLAQRTGGSATSVHLDAEEVAVHGRTAEALYRIAQEAVGNALRHARAANVWLRLRRRGRRLQLEVADDGVGFAPARAGNGLGLAGMRTRAGELSGTLQIDSAPGQGTRLLAEVPWPGD